MEEHVPDTPLGRMYREHIRLLASKDLEGVLDQYTDDAIVISSFNKGPQGPVPTYFRGRDQLREHFQGLFSAMKSLEVDTAFWGETQNPDTLMIVEAVTLEMNSGDKADMRFADSWVLRDGKIAIHFAGMVQYPDGSIA